MPEPTDLSDADEQILRHLTTAGVDYPALVAANTGLHIPLVERRMATLEERGFIEAATAERIYRVTEGGRNALADVPAVSVGGQAADGTVADGGTSDLDGE